MTSRLPQGDRLHGEEWDLQSNAAVPPTCHSGVFGQILDSAEAPFLTLNMGEKAAYSSVTHGLSDVCCSG